ncbi:hypothetical protein [Maribellus sediminis]|uniref:hypothetical protein n=1 Tax=Maribellus sediminis TaxID=2696285 RepID=UPI0014311F9D|nr:hypothetical protein [Maribellus sediminis]
MQNNVVSKLASLGDISLDLDSLLTEITSLKHNYVAKNDDSKSKEYWIYEEIVKIHKNYLEAFKLIQNKEYYKGWCKLENIEISIQFLKPHFPFKDNLYRLSQIERNVKNLQAIFPYRMFTSIEMIKKEVKCNICDKIITPRNPCPHKVGEIYLGEMCLRVVTKSDILGIAFVENPVNKYTVPFIKESDDGETIDHYDYTVINYLFETIKHPFERWDLVTRRKYAPHENYKDIKPEDYCPCNSTKKYSECCLKKDGVEYIHYEFLLERHVNKKRYRNFKTKR